MPRERSFCTSPALPSAGHGSGPCLHATPSCALTAAASPCPQLSLLIPLLAADNPQGLVRGRMGLGLSGAWDVDWAMAANPNGSTEVVEVDDHPGVCKPCATRALHMSCEIQSEAKRCPLSSHAPRVSALSAFCTQLLPQMPFLFLFCFVFLVPYYSSIAKLFRIGICMDEISYLEKSTSVKSAQTCMVVHKEFAFL